MRKIIFAAFVFGSFLVINACSKKSSSPNNARTVQNLSGSYTITALTANAGGLTINLYDSLPACEKDNTIQLDANGIATIYRCRNQVRSLIRFLRHLEPFAKYRYHLRCRQRIFY